MTDSLDLFEAALKKAVRVLRLEPKQTITKSRRKRKGMAQAQHKKSKRTARIRKLKKRLTPQTA
jgi:hypothetical protein